VQHEFAKLYFVFGGQRFNSVLGLLQDSGEIPYTGLVFHELGIVASYKCTELI